MENVSNNSGLAVVKVDRFRGTTKPDKNGRPSMILIAISGQIPNRNVIAGTVADMQGLEEGKTYLVQYRKRGIDKVFGEDYAWTKVQEVTTIKDQLDAINSLGNGDIFRVQRPAGFEDVYHRKGDKVESLQTMRAKQGQYEFTTHRDVNSKTASEVVPGTTITGANEDQLRLTDKDLPKDKRNATPAPKDESLNP